MSNFILTTGNREREPQSSWTVACQAPLSMAFPRQEYCSGLPFPSPGDLPNLEIEHRFPALAGGFFITLEALRQYYEVDTIITPTL